MPTNQLPNQPPNSDQNGAGGDHSSGDGWGEFLSGTAYIPDTIGDANPNDVNAAQGVQTPPVSTIPPELIEQALGPSFNAIFNALGARRGEHWRLKDFEKNALVMGWTPIVQHLLSRLGSSEQVMFTLALTSTAAIVGGKVAQDATKRVSRKANIRTPGSVASSVSLASAEAERQPEQSDSSTPLDES